MDKNFWNTILSNLSSPDKVSVRRYEGDYYGIFSSENSNDTYDWFHVNSRQLELNLQDKGFSWCYVIETAPSATPFIYLFTSPNMSKDFIKHELNSYIEEMPKGRHVYFEDCSFSNIDIDKYDNSISALEKELYRKASDVFRVYEV